MSPTSSFFSLDCYLMEESNIENDSAIKQGAASDMFDEFYNFCLENGIEPEQIVKDYGEMMLVTNQEDVDRCEELLDS
jgi:hypothetical protein